MTMISSILLVEDDKSSAFLIRKILQKHSYHVLLASNGIEALQLIAKHPVDLVITDVVMPHMDGIDLYDELKKREDTKNLPVIIITDKQLFKEAFTAVGVEHFIPKSAEISLLLDKIQHINADLQKKEYRKILISGGNSLIVEQMRKILVDKNFLVATADNSLDTLNKAFLMSPHILLLDLRMDDRSKAKEIIESFRCFHYFHHMQILTYAYLTPEEMVNASTIWEMIKVESRICAESGASKFIGNFTEATFLKNIQEHIEEDI
jgi:CheY-like chemotaxis protein